MLQGNGITLSRPVGLGLQIAEALKIAILEGNFKGGAQLGEQDLQAQFGVSRSPLREAFRELEKLGLVEIIPRRGTFVKRISRNDIEENFPVRAALEGLAAELAHATMNRDTLSRMAVSLQQMSVAAVQNDVRSYYHAHLEFHELFIHQAGNVLLEQTLARLRMQNLWHRFSYQYYQEDINKSLAIHQRIYEQLENPRSSPGTIRSLVEGHINDALESFLLFLSKFEQDESGETPVGAELKR
ncbi:MAG: GntR family transcriptional regulator [Desulfobulbaceae bacterium]|nr:MAG: GntR family transcriptional regulator [Desulfobulbaceae bacterium]